MGGVLTVFPDPQSVGGPKALQYNWSRFAIQIGGVVLGGSAKGMSIERREGSETFLERKWVLRRFSGYFLAGFFPSKIKTF